MGIIAACTSLDSASISTIIAALGVGGGGGAWLHKWFTDRRNALPLPRAKWENHPQGWEVTIELVNRLDEDIFVERVDAKGEFFVPPPRENGLAWFPPQELNWVIDGRRILPNIRVDRGDSHRMHFYISGVDTPRWIALTVSSSLKTIRCKRLIIRDMPKL